jgi:hypothetical protein
MVLKSPKWRRRLLRQAQHRLHPRSVTRAFLFSGAIMARGSVAELIRDHN